MRKLVISLIKPISKNMNNHKRSRKGSRSTEQCAKSSIVVVRLKGSSKLTYSIHRETYLRNPETCEMLLMTAWHNVPLYPTFWPVEEEGTVQFAIVFPPMPKHWRLFEFWEMRGEDPFYAKGIQRNTDEVYIVHLSYQ